MGRKLEDSAPIPRSIFDDFGDNWCDVPNLMMLHVVRLESTDPEIKVDRLVLHCIDSDDCYLVFFDFPLLLSLEVEKIFDYKTDSDVKHCRIYILKVSEFRWNILKIIGNEFIVLSSFPREP